MARTWLITGASRGLGAEIVNAALRAGDQVVAAARNPAAVTQAHPTEGNRLLPVELNVSEPGQVGLAVDAAMRRFGAIDVLVNNAGYGQFGFFEECTLEDAQGQLATNVLGVFNVTWAVLPVMRAARRGRIFNVSSLAGLVGAQLASLYCASKFALEGFSESLANEVAPFGIHVTLIEPGPFRTDFLTSRSLRTGEKRIADYDDRRAALFASVEARNGKQPGDPAKLARAIVELASTSEPPLRLLAGSLAAAAADQKLSSMRAEFDRWREVALGTDGSYSDSAGVDSMTSQFSRSAEAQPARSR